MIEDGAVTNKDLNQSYILKDLERGGVKGPRSSLNLLN